MPLQTTTMAAPARAAQARVDWTERCLESDEVTATLSGWRVGLAVATVAAVGALLAIPVIAVFDPTFGGWAAGSLGRLAAIAPVMTAVRALACVVAVIAISRPDAQR
jgi:hypothetical protein